MRLKAIRFGEALLASPVTPGLPGCCCSCCCWCHCHCTTIATSPETGDDELV